MKKHFRIPMQYFAKEEKPEEKASETEEEKKSETPAEEKPAQEKKEEPAKEEKASDDKQADENGEGADTPPAEEKGEDKPEEEKAPEAPKLSETDELRAENLRLKTQLEAIKVGFNPECLEDAVVLAENIVKRDGSDISTALQAVAKKYPDWKSGGKEEKSKAGFKVGADTPKDKKADDEQLNSAFGLRRKK